MKKLIIGIALIIAPTVSLAAGTQCIGKVIRVMDHSQQCGGKFAYMIDNSNGKWFCTPTKEGGSIALAALMADKKVASVFDASVSSEPCSSISKHYISPIYLHVMKE
ncbi:hypothetical protein [Grimontia sp. NTOU-MAR1]|uniref:hypothetical protein n=1 Tax=Grimontia sp. NTOU-MAR1 TaxID=3111011 RepID=UPI002DB9BE04|nr:hypothetical protein [Grimontia sp. NTOU-MAR1]WRV98334.1 hypothetical protein VP504_02545 [Grimontia sp. NTOU-MAR1]